MEAIEAENDAVIKFSHIVKGVTIRGAAVNPNKNSFLSPGGLYVDTVYQKVKSKNGQYDFLIP